MLLAYARIVKVGDGRLGEDAGEQGRDVGRVAGQKDDAEAAPDVDEELVGPWFRRLEGHQVAEEEAPHDPKGGGKAKVFRPLAAPRVEAERAEPLVDGHSQGRQVEADEDADPQVGLERFEEGQQRDVVVSLAGLQDGQSRIEVRDWEVDGLAPHRRHAQWGETQMGRTRTQIGHNSVPLAGPFGAALPVGHHVHLEFHLQVVGHVLHQVDRVAVAARQVVETALVLLGALVVAENAGQLVLLAGGYAQARHARQATLFLFFLVVFLEHFRLHHERRREDGRHPVDSTTVRTRSSKSSAGPLNSCNKKRKKRNSSSFRECLTGNLVGAGKDGLGRALTHTVPKFHRCPSSFWWPAVKLEHVD